MNVEESQLLIKKGEKQYFDFVKRIGLKQAIKTPHSYQLFDLGKVDPDDDEFIILAIEILYDELFTIHLKTERRY